MRWISWHFTDGDVWCYYEVDDEDCAARQVELQGPEHVPITAAARSELDAQPNIRRIQAYEATYGVLAEAALSPWPEPPPQMISRDQFEQLWAAARRHLEQQQSGAWRWQDGSHRYLPPDQDAWANIRASLQVGQHLSGTIVWVPQPGIIGIGVDLGLPVGGFVDVLLLPHDPQRWPELGSHADFEIWSMDDRPQIRLRPLDPTFLREDFDEWILRNDPKKSA